MLPGIGIQAPHLHEETLGRKFVAGLFSSVIQFNVAPTGVEPSALVRRAITEIRALIAVPQVIPDTADDRGENRLEKSFNDSAKEREKPADTFPRDRPKAVPKRPNNKTNRRGAHGRRSRVLDQNMRRTDSTRRAGNGGQRVASFCSSAAAFLSPCAVIAASATSRDRASTPVSATPRAADRPPADPRITHRRNITKPIHQH
ncbi:hypothetical protein QZM79_26560 [Burkholderia multivorans]|nr:hypothetical protein [Burkholderia multivorans]